MTMAPEESDAAASSNPPDAEGPIRVSREAAAFIGRLSGGLELWSTRTEAALFLAALAAARDVEPADVHELGELEQIGHTDEAEDTPEGLAVIGLLGEDAPAPGVVREQRLPGWVEAGMDLAAPRIQGASVSEAAREVVALIEETRTDGAASESGAA